MKKITTLLSSFAFIALFIVFLIAGSQLALMLKEPIPKLYYGLFGTLGALLALFIFLKVEGKSFDSLGLKIAKRTATNFLKGVLLGTAIFMIMILAFLAFGGMYLQKINAVDYGKIALSLLPFIPLALMEELGFRTYPFLNISSKLGVWYAQIVIAILFALYHILMGWPVQVAFLGPFIWSFAFGWSALWSKGIAMPFGFHLALNWMQNLVGMKNEASALFKLNYRNDPSKELVATNEYLGIGMHLIILSLACFLTYRYCQSKKLL